MIVVTMRLSRRTTSVRPAADTLMRMTAPSHRPRLLAASAVLTLLTLSSSALSHGEAVRSDLKGVRPCLSDAAVKISAVGRTTARQREVQGRLSRDLRTLLETRLRREKVLIDERAVCPATAPAVTLAVKVRYLDPAAYAGFGDPAYSYDLLLTVGRGAAPAKTKTTAPRFVAAYADIHSEAKTKRGFETALRTWTAELAGDLAQAWRRDGAARPGPG